MFERGTLEQHVTQHRLPPRAIALTRSLLLPLPRICCSPKQLRQAALIQTKGRSEEVLTEKAAVCLSALERYIGSKKFMFGTK